MTERILQLLEEKKYPEIRRLVQDLNPADAAEIMGELTESHMPLVFRMLPKELAADTFTYMNADSQELLIKGFSDKELDEMMSQLFVDDAVELIEEMPASVVKRILRAVDAETRVMINQILNYPKESAGSMMTMEYVDLKAHMTVEQAFDRIRRTGVEKETVYTCYVTDSTRRLEGIVTVKDLIFAQKTDLIQNIMETNVIFVSTLTDQEIVAKEFGKYDFLALPVVDAENRLVGIVTIDDAMDVLQEETTEDIEKMSGITPTDKPYLKMTVFETWKKRVPWLLVLMISSTFTSKIIQSYEAALASAIILTNFIPMLMNTGGNAGGQSSATLIRGMSLGEVRYRDIFKVLWKEVAVSVYCGLTLAAANFVKLILIDRIDIPVALVVCLTLIVVVIAANLVGVMLPMLAKKIGFDPAVMSSPVVTTVVDALSLTIYFNLATRLLRL